MRVREALEIAKVRQQLRYKLPKECLVIPEQLADVRSKYPMTLMKLFPEKYSMLGVITEYLLRYPVEQITNDLVRSLANKMFGVDIPIATLQLKTSIHYLDNARATRKKIDSLNKNRDDLLHDVVLTSSNIEGHPDICCGSHIYEVKTSGRIKQCWNEFIMQVMAYASLDSSATHVHLVFPLDSYVWSFDLSKWDKTKRKAYKDILEKAESLAPAPILQENVLMANVIMSTYGIGTHVPKLKTLPLTLQSIIDNEIDAPVQIFLGGTTSLVLKDIPDLEIAQAFDLVQKHNIQLYIHAPYTINLSDKTTSSAIIPCLVKHLEIGSAIGAKGVVVHVGKHCNRYKNEEIARNNMKIMLHDTLKSLAGMSCPLLLETPAGQGTEILVKMEDFIEFAQELASELPEHENKLFGICIDTCHVFATGSCPKKYIQYALEKADDKLKLIHYNDSMGDCGSCVDRHAMICCGKIDKQILIDCATIAFQHNIPMVME